LVCQYVGVLRLSTPTGNRTKGILTETEYNDAYGNATQVTSTYLDPGGIRS